MITDPTRKGDREKGTEKGTDLFITSSSACAGKRIDSELAPWARATGAVAREMKTPFIDLHNASVALHNALGSEASMAFNPRDGDLTHFNRTGAGAIADLVVDRLLLLADELSARLK